ncbi:MAG: lytic transglycosylase domain-containing protein [Bacteroidota bacterium]|nr:lytic transglycosylase domain-containing protein [Bacteroidota bacterium]
MLKRKLYKVGFIILSLISVAVASGSVSNSKKPVTIPPVSNKTGTHQFDSSGLCTCIPFIIKDEQLKAPRIQLHKNAATFVKEYMKKNGFFLGKTKHRIAPYFTMIDSVFNQHKLPVELKYLAYVESGLQHNLISRSGAVGPWALMPVAAKEYGLSISKQQDERLDYYKSSTAAARLLTDLFAKYGDWLLVIAAYNCGPGGVQKAIKRSGSRNYWALQNLLPEETRKHVKKFIAVHYYFEGHGSLATMTKAETEKHIREVEAYVSQQEEKKKTDSLAVVL